LRAEILVDRHMWRLDDPSAAHAAVKEVTDHALATLLAAQLEYWRRLFDQGGEVAGDPVAGLAKAIASAGDPALAGWATFHHAIVSENLDDDAVTSAEGYRRARDSARQSGDLFLESYAVRHQGDQLIHRQGDRGAGIALLRRSLAIRAGLGTRPQVAAAQSSLARELPPGPEADELLEISRHTAAELRIPWLR
jgi:hypothetical protein